MDLKPSKNLDIRLAILFGSRAVGNAVRDSDTDVAILADRALSLDEKAELAVRFGDQLGVSEDAVDLIDLWDVSPLLAWEIAEKGKLIHGVPYDFLRFRVLAWKRYLDTAKFRRLRHDSLLAHASRTR